MYKTGGLEPKEDENILPIDGINYVVSDKFRMMLRDSFIDWGTFLEIYHDNLDYATLFDQIIKLLNVKENESIRHFLIPMVKKIYALPAEAHMTCMLKQFIIYEPVSVAIHSIFITIKMFYEHLIEQFLITRNRYIELNNTKDKTNDLTQLKEYWSSLNQQYNLETSSLLLLFINPPNGLKSGIYFAIEGNNAVAKFKQSIKQFHYKGFCIKEPHKRLRALLEFPVNDIIAAISKLDSIVEFPNFKKVENYIAEKIKLIPEPIKIKDTFVRLKPPADIESDEIALAKWYIEAILELRKELLPYGSKYEEYYIQKAKVFTEINRELKQEFNKFK